MDKFQLGVEFGRNYDSFRRGVIHARKAGLGKEVYNPNILQRVSDLFDKCLSQLEKSGKLNSPYARRLGERYLDFCGAVSGTGYESMMDRNFQQRADKLKG